MQLQDLLSQCAESKVYNCDFYGTPAVCKHRFAKSYRHPKLDQKLREQRTVREARALVRCRKHGVRAPTVFAVDKQQCQIVMERIEGEAVKSVVDRTCASLADSHKALSSPLLIQILKGMGEVVGLLHNADIIHGDLTTSNFLYTPVCVSELFAGAFPAIDRAARDGLVVIDFGLVVDKSSPEERAVDLYVLERAITSTHPMVEAFASKLVLEGYLGTVEPSKGRATLSRLEVVRARGRKRSMIG